MINPQTGEIREFSPEEPLKAPEAMFFDIDGNLWITEHTGLALVKFDPIFETFEKFSVPDSEALPFGMTSDRYGNIWFAQHTVDKLAVYDPHNNNSSKSIYRLQHPLLNLLLQMIKKMFGLLNNKETN